MLPITKAAVKYLRASGVTVISDADTNNNKNMIADVKWANKEKVDIYVSLHCDWYKAPTGTLPLYVSAGGKKLATTINNAVMSGMGMKTRGVTKRSDLYELNYTDSYATIFECGSLKADIKKLKDSDKYGKCIAQGICNYLGIAFEESAPAPAPTPTTSHLYRVRKTWADSKSQVGAYKSLDNAKEECDKHPGYSVFDENGKAVYISKSAAPNTSTLYRVRKSWNDAKSQVGAFKELENAKKVADEKGLNVYGSNGKLVYEGKKEATIIDELLDACKTQAEWAKNAEYAWQEDPTIEKSKKFETCVTFVACVLQRISILKSKQYIWINSKGKVFGTNSKMTVTYMKGTLASNKSELKRGDIIIGGNGKVGAGQGSHIFILTGKWNGDNPYIYDQASASRVKNGKSATHTWKGSFPMIVLIRLK